MWLSKLLAKVVTCSYHDYDMIMRRLVMMIVITMTI